jgi:predicted unusual protein kinase regulating ubiquinone biosynthesis (AarF/ABC1/UbiB family)
MAFSLKTEHLKRYKQIAQLFVKYGRSDLVANAGLEADLELAAPAAPAADVEELARSLADDLEALGPTFIKLGQLLSTRPDLLPLPFVEALARLQDDVEAFSYPEAEAIITAELGVRVSKLFREFEREPIAAASLGQVHRAWLRDGRPVAVKVQRPGIRERVQEDLEALEEIAQMLDKRTALGARYQFAAMLHEFRRSLIKELDYRQEARNLAVLRENLARFDRIVVPAAIEDYTTGRVLTIEYVRGQKVTAFNPVVRTELDGEALAEQLFQAYLRQVLIDGFVHADPHPGNVFLTDDDRIALLDLGMVTHVSPAMQEKLLQMLLAIGEGRSDEVATIAIAIGDVREDDFDEAGFRRKVAELVADTRSASLDQIQLGRSILLVSRMSAESGVRVPSELILLGKTLLNLDQVGRALDPTFDPNASIRRNAAELTAERVRRSLSPGNLMVSLIELRDFAQRLPARLNRLFDHLADNKLKVNVDAIDEKLLMEGFQKVANRITAGLVLAALIVGAALLTQVPSSFEILGYPALATLFFLAAAGGGVFLLADIFRSDYRRSRKDNR